MFTEEFLGTYPLSIQEVKRIFKERALLSFKDLEVDPDIQDDILHLAIGDYSIVSSLNNNPCIYYEIFDEYGIYVSVFPTKVEREIKFSFKIQGKNVEIGINSLDKRRDADYKAIKEAFVLLEEQLSAKKELEG
jgi:hypothetical protein